MLKKIANELKSHAPFTIAGALSGVLVMFFFQRLPFKTAYNIFYILHPMHVVLSALVTSSMYEIHKCGCSGKKCNIFILLAIGYFGSVGIATLSDSLIPYIGETLLNLPKRGAHIGFIEEWWIVNPAALLGIAIAYFLPRTKFPHMGHVLVSTWASLFHIIMSLGGNIHVGAYALVFIFLFVAVWVPCCVSDIIFPLLFVHDKEHKH